MSKDIFKLYDNTNNRFGTYFYVLEILKLFELPFIIKKINKLVLLIVAIGL